MSEVLTCANLAEAVLLAETVEKTAGFILMPRITVYFNTTYEMKRALINKENIGELMHAEGEYIHDWFVNLASDKHTDKETIGATADILHFTVLIRWARYYMRPGFVRSV